MRITWLGTASILIESPDARIAIDPYLRRLGCELPPFPLDALHDVDAIFITHPHLDHFADIAEIMRACSAPVYVCRRGLEIAAAEGIPRVRLHELRPGDTVSCGTLTVRAHQGCHCRVDAALVVRTLARCLQPFHLHAALVLARLNRRHSIDLARDVLAFEVRALDESVLVLGSAALPSNVEYPRTDALVFPYQGRSDMAAYSIPLIRHLGIPHVVLSHFDDAFPPVSQAMQPEEFVELALEELRGVRVEIPEYRRAIEL